MSSEAYISGHSQLEEIINFPYPDELFSKAVKLAMLNGGCSMSFLQRMLSIGYSRAARFIDCMLECGFIKKEEDSKFYKILITQEEFEKYFKC